MKDNQSIYRSFCEKHPEIPLFLQAWWLDAVCTPENKKWDVWIYYEGNDIVATMVFHTYKKLGFTFLTQPQLTQHSGIWINYPSNISTNRKYSLEKRICDFFIGQIEQAHIHYYQQCWHYKQTNWLPFYWHHFTQTTRYTYRIENISDTEKVFQNFNDSKKKNIRRAAKTCSITYDIKPVDFYNFQCKQLAVKNQTNVLSKQLVTHVINESIRSNHGFLIGANNEEGKLIAALFIVYDQNSAYDLISAIDMEYQSTGASSLLVWEAIKKVSSLTKVFDFEGSMIESVEHSFRKFGAIQTPYHCITKEYSRLCSTLLKLKNKWSK